MNREAELDENKIKQWGKILDSFQEIPEAKAAIDRLVIEGRLDEWNRMAELYPTAPYIPEFIWKERVAELLSQSSQPLADSQDSSSPTVGTNQVDNSEEA